ncbi:septum formation initiator family protein [Isoptericola sp. S6320L]|uniref:septum formation initiator family protein n=1 Tax=Isoptericola sp. S6320L TaxID=2926411 RepID=UPI001FF4C186|nr:septum formation initiator family protein [Isoptericola sp. S6320L]MCK0118291.1 septum formation initiator family protein [Isoptericola sp. S6320L]
MRWFATGRRHPVNPPSGPPPERDAELVEVEQDIADAQQELAALKDERTELLAERRRLQQVLAERAGRRTMPRSRVEKTTGVPSLVAGVRLFQRIHRRAPEPSAGIDGVGKEFSDPELVARFARSHGVPSEVASASASEVRTVVVHAFHGTVGLVEIRQDGLSRHLDGSQQDVGDIRAAASYGVDIPVSAAIEDICGWSATLSRHIPRPYVQVLWHEGTDGPVLTCIDVDPDRVPVLTPEWDLRLGQLFDSAHARMLLQPYRVGALDNRIPGGTFLPEETS